ncbi:hypothetical protein GCM10011584_04300 [Nocardioides phosphati]|uniref:Thioredoxin domain-containing protein n=1 Tax=Nocardioides phosphati TaxID=1867775 RepID=A0ABQ2N5B4_9ACTN|nr:redoxin family protein [Nocardioides phosphati]GGO85120.1 hypothetical protein GCM10011584_04300 [Nocardioides phosphati]
MLTSRRTSTTISSRSRLRRRCYAAPLALGALALLLSACGGLTKDTSTAANSNPPTAGTTASTFIAQKIGGGSLQLPGARPAVLLFFGVECGGCGPTATALAEVQADRSAVADFAAVDIVPGESIEDIKGFLSTNKATSLAFASDSDGSLFQRYGVTSLTTVVIVDAGGKVVYRAVEPSADTIRSELAKVTG